MTDRREQFCQQYLLDLNGSAAARRAGYSEHTAHEQASQLMKEEEVITRIRQLMDERAARVKIDQDYVLMRLMELSQVGDMSTQLEAVKAIGKHLHMFNDKLDINITLARQAEAYAKLTPEQQLQLMKEQTKLLEAQLAQQPTDIKETT
jgi:phage terminase small subunit